MKKTMIAILAVAMLMALFCGQALAINGDITVVDVKAYSDSAMTNYVGTIPASTAVVVRSYDNYADIYLNGKVVYISTKALLHKNVASDYIADLAKGTTVYQRASTTAAKITTKKAASVSVCYVLNDWALVKSRNGKGFYGFVTVDKLSNIRMR